MWTLIIDILLFSFIKSRKKPSTFIVIALTFIVLSYAALTIVSNVKFSR
jgi:hypothetical protein